MTIFDHYKNLVQKNSRIDIDNGVSIFYLTKLLSFNILSIKYINRIIKYVYYVPKNTLYRYYWYSLPKQKRVTYVNISKEKEHKYLECAKKLFPEMSTEKLKENMIFLEKTIKGLLDG